MPAQVLSASRRTDIPALFPAWLMHRVRAGFVMVRNPRNPAHVMRVSLAARDVIAIVFWSRDYGRLFEHLQELEDRGLRACFQFTLTGYGRSFEPGVPGVPTAIHQFEQLSRRFGRRRVVWRYDPIVVGSEHSVSWHVKQFQLLAGRLAPAVSDAVISLLDLYPSARRGLHQLSATSGETFEPPTLADRVLLARELVAIGANLGIRVRACCEPELVLAAGIQAARCIDPELIGEVAGRAALELKPSPTRKGCGCVVARDIGAYHCCVHGCVYCYANDSPQGATLGAQQVETAANHLGAGDIDEQRPTRPVRQAQLRLQLGEDDTGKSVR